MSHQPPTMAQTAQQPLAQNRAYSPQQHSPSPTMTQHPHNMPQQQQQNVRPRVSPDPRSPTFNPGFANPQGHNTPAIRTPTSGLPSPSLPPYAQHQIHQQPQYNASQIPHQNGRLTPNAPPQRFAPPHPQPNSVAPAANHTTAHLPNPSLPQQTPVPPPNLSSHGYSNATFSPTAQSTGSGIMGPPQQAAPKAAPVKTVMYDMDDTLAGTGINLDEEEQYMNDYEARTGFGALPPRGRGSFYGAGPANQAPEQTQAKTHEEMVAEAADKAWNDAAYRYGISRTQDFIEEGFVHPGVSHAHMAKIAAANNLELNYDQKPPNPNLPLGRFPNPNLWEKPQIKVTTKTSPDGTLVQTEGSFIPKDAYLIDMIALLSLATKERMRELLAEANDIATHRQNTAHGNIPTEWIDAAEPQPQPKLDSAISPRTKPLKRAADEMSNGLPTPVSEASPANHVADTIVALGKRAREVEEARLRKRQKRAEQAAEKEKNADGPGASRSGSVAPGTPGSVAPEQPEAKPLSKKESKKAAKLLDTSSVSVNSTVSQFMGKKAKRYSWMSGGGGGGSGSGTSTPRGPAGAFSGAAAGSSGRAAKGPLTQDPSQKLGDLREDSAKGKNIQMRDWIDVLEHNCYLTDQEVLQQAYVKLDRSDWGDKAKIPSPPPASIAAPSPTPSAAATPSTALAAAASPMALTPVGGWTG